jgi:hypothetical protein
MLSDELQAVARVVGIYRADTRRMREQLQQLRSPATEPVVPLLRRLIDDAARDAAFAWAELHRPEGVP